MSDESKLANEEKRQQKINALEQNEKKKKLIFGALVAVLVAVFLGGIFWGLTDVLSAEGTMDNPNDTILSVTPETVQDGIDKLKEISELAYNPENSSKIKLNASTSLSVDSDSISTNSDKLTEVLKYMKDDILSRVSEKYEGFGEAFGTDYTNELHPNDFTASDIEAYECIEDENNRTLLFTFIDAEYPQAEDSVLYRNFGMSLCSDIQKAVKDLISPIATVNNLQISCVGFNISASYNATEDRLNTITYNRCYEVKANVTFTGELDALGAKDISFKFTASENHGFTYAQLVLNKDRIWLEKGERDNLTATRVYDESILDEAGKDGAKVLWSISDPEVATIDDEGYIKALKVSDKPVTVTAKYTFLGNEYTDTCLVYVRDTLDGIAMKEKEATLVQGETKTLEIKFTPEKATFKDVDWFTSDESVAVVDENGVVTAVGAGSADIYAIALDGNFKTTCKLTVKDGAK